MPSLVRSRTAMGKVGRAHRSPLIKEPPVPVPVLLTTRRQRAHLGRGLGLGLANLESRAGAVGEVRTLIRRQWSNLVPFATSGSSSAPPPHLEPSITRPLTDRQYDTAANNEHVTWVSMRVGHAWANHQSSSRGAEESDVR